MVGKNEQKKKKTHFNIFFSYTRSHRRPRLWPTLSPGRRLQGEKCSLEINPRWEQILSNLDNVVWTNGSALVRVTLSFQNIL